MNDPQTFNVLILIGRPASGKSEIVDYLKKASPSERRSRFHLADLEILDDFPMLWAWFEEDHLLSEKLGQARLYTDSQGYFIQAYFWDLLIERLGLEYQKRLRVDPYYHDQKSVILEFSRGSQHGGYCRAFEHLPDELLQRAGVIYVNVTFEESLRKNRLRFNPERPNSILEHSLPDAKMKRLYEKDDWDEFKAGHPQYLQVGDNRLPYAVFENQDDITTDHPDLLAARLEEVTSQLWRVYHSNR